MRIEVTDLVPSTELEPGDLYSNKPQEWWDQSLAAPQIGVVLFIRSEFALPEAYLGTATYKIIVHKDEEGVAPSGTVHIADEDPEAVLGIDPGNEDDPVQDEPFHCSSCGGMGTDDGGEPCGTCQGTGATPRG